MFLNVAQVVFGISSIALLKANIAPENRPSQKEVSSSNPVESMYCIVAYIHDIYLIYY